MRRLTIFLSCALFLLATAACSRASSTQPSTSTSPTTLKLAFLGDMSVPAPDVFYDIEGNTVILSTYEGLLRYAPDSTAYEPVLATSWDVSSDGLTYTFHLRSGVMFHDGTAFDSAAAKASFQRRTAASMYPGALLPPGQAKFGTAFDATAATAAVKAAGSPKIDFAYTADASGLQRRLSEIVQQRLQAAGFQVSVRQVELPVVYDWANKPANGADMLLMTNTPDAAHPDTWARIVWGSTGGLNFLGYNNPKVDATLDQAILLTDKTQTNTLYAQIGTMVSDDVAYIPLADTKDVMITRSDITGLAHIPNYPWTLDMSKLARKSG